MIEHTFCIQGSHRQTTVVAQDIVSAANDAAWLLNLAEHERLLWLPPLPPLVRQTEQSPALAPIESVIEPRSEGTTTTVTIDLVGMGRSYFPIFLQNAEQYWDTFHKSKESDLEALARYCIMLCGAIDAISSVKALEQIRVHVWRTSGMPQELMAPTFDLALDQLVSLRARFLAPYDRRTFRLFLCVLAFTCLAVPIEQGALDRLRECLTVVERQCAALVEGIGYSAQRAEQQEERL